MVIAHTVYNTSGTSPIQTPMGQKKVSLLVKCPHFRGRNARKSGTWGRKRCALDYQLTPLSLE